MQMELKVDHAAVVPLMPLFMQQIEFKLQNSMHFPMQESKTFKEFQTAQTI